jgi:hypothetical protein
MFPNRSEMKQNLLVIIAKLSIQYIISTDKWRSCRTEQSSAMINLCGVFQKPKLILLSTMKNNEDSNFTYMISLGSIA